MLIVILLPYIEASIILKLVHDHLPEVIKKFYIPWPFMVVQQSVSPYVTRYFSREFSYEY